ncbi:RICIN domain-containing protein [Streptomyces sp. NPDC047043]|uniref:RICIN domain-containing protein n=1 Tax=Streptomyces sp. NPDC047043 TaxID=3154497 RepID=UPI00340D6FB4
MTSRHPQDQSHEPSRRLLLGLGLGALSTAALAAIPSTAAATTGTRAASGVGTEAVVPAAGTWSIALDPGDQGVAQAWFADDLPKATRIHLPGDTDQAGLGDTPGPQWASVPSDIDPAIRDEPLFRLSRPSVYTGAAWYQHTVEVPDSWAGLDVELFLERCLWQSQVWVDSTHAGTQDSLSTPHLHQLGALTPGTHRLTLRIDNSDIHHSAVTTVSAHAYGDDTQTIWNGVVGRIELRARERVRITDVQVYPDAATRSLKVVTAVANTGTAPASAVLTLGAGSADTPVRGRRVRVTAAPGASEVATTVPLHGEIRFWDEFTPAVHRLRATLTASGAPDTVDVPFGLRELRADSTQFSLNGRTIQLRGTHDGGAFPLTGYAPMDVDSWRGVFKVITDHGLNHYRCHSWCPPDAAFTAADEAGVLIHVELPAAFEDVSPDADPDRSDFVAAELDRILAAYGNHPSFCLLSMGNELSGKSRTVLTKWVAHARQTDPRHLYTVSSNPEAMGAYLPDPEDQYMVAHSAKVDGVRMGRRLESTVDSEKPDTSRDYAATLAGIGIPVLSHEVGQWSVYPDYREIDRYKGVLRPRNLEAYRRSLDGHGMLDLADAFVRASGRLSLRLYKEEVERALRSPGFGGFQLLDLHDYPGQGTALIGLLNVFWQSKGIVSAREFRRFCGPVVPLLRLDSLVWRSSQTLSGTVQVANYGRGDVTATPRWTVLDDEGRTVAKGRLPRSTYQQGGLRDAGPISLPLDRLDVPRRYRIEVELPGTEYANDWNIWVLPDTVSADPAENVTVTSDLASTLTALAAGRRVLFLAAGKLTPAGSDPVSSTTPFWNTLMFTGSPKSMGILCDPGHPALAHFPTEGFADWHWWELLSATTGARVSRLDAAPATYRPVVQVVHHAPENHKLGAVYEFEVGPGRLLVSTLDLTTDPTGRPVAAQLLRSLLDYAASDAFSPTAPADTALLRSLFTTPGVQGLKGPYRLVNAHSGLVLDTAGSGTSNGTPLVQSASDAGGSGQRWTFTATADGGYYTLTGVSSARAVDIPNNTGTPDTQLELWTPTGGANQQWLVLPSGEGYTLTARSSGLNLDVRQGSTEAGAAVVQAAPSDSATQVWKLVDAR